MTKQRDEDPAPKQDNDDAPAEFIDDPENLPGDQEKTPTPSQ